MSQIICISGMSGSGKNSVGELVAKSLRMRLVNPTFKTLARERGVSLMEYQQMANENRRIDIDFDRAIGREAAKGNCVITTWLGPWMVKKCLRVWLQADEKTRAARIAKRDKMSMAAALAHLKKRDADNGRRYAKLYGIDITRHADFDLIINTKNFRPRQSAAIVIAAAKANA
ncbi:MAG: cytidylate kinase family protein [Candidatus Micrarchaeota archaeon]|nr:cytidylate kinase family protein [Candidatus Micrarchaeota archaeon]